MTVEEQGERLRQIAGKRFELARELQGVKCFCSAKKRAMQTFCRKDYFALPPAIRTALYKGVFDGYVEAYAEARKFLEGRSKNAR